MISFVYPRGNYSNLTLLSRSTIDIDFLTILISFSIMAFCPLLVIYFWMACDSFQCSLWAPIPFVLEGASNFDDVKAGIVRLVVERFPRPTPGEWWFERLISLWANCIGTLMNGIDWRVL